MTRQEVISAYEVDASGIIKSPGKFEGEMLYVPALWDSTLDGGAAEELYFDDSGEMISIVAITEEDRKEFPELAMITEVGLQESDQGFVFAQLDPTVLAQVRKEYEDQLNVPEAKVPETAPQEGVPEEASVKAEVADNDQADTALADASIHADAKALVVSAMGYTDLQGSLRAAYLLGQAQDKIWKGAVKEIKKKHEKEMKKRVAALTKWGTAVPSKAAVKDIIAKVLIENGISAYPNLIQALYANPFQTQGLGAETVEDRQVSEPR